jgi:hypothetical protein
MSSLRDKEVFIAVKEMLIGGFEVGIWGVSMGKCMSKLVVEGLTFIFKPSIHRVGFFILGDRLSELGGVRVGCESCLPNGG